MVMLASSSRPVLRSHEDTAQALTHTAVSLQEIVENDYRLEASVFNADARQARNDVQNCVFPVVALCGEDGLAQANHEARFKRVYVEKSDYPLYQPAQINEIYPKPTAFISDLTPTDIDALKVKRRQVLLTCSGTIGHCTYVSRTLDNLIFSHDLIRIESKKYSGYIYAYLKSRIGFQIIGTNSYGGVVKHIEPEHLNDIPIPNPPSILKQKIHDLIEKSFDLRDKSNDLMDDAQELLKESFQFPSVDNLKTKVKQFDRDGSLQNYSVSLGKVNYRLDGSYYVPITQVLKDHLYKHALEVTTVGDPRISQSVILPGRFKRVYVEKGRGITFLGGKQILKLDPNNKKYLSLVHHEDRIKEQLTLHENFTLITCSGTIGKVALVPKHWDGWTANQHVIRVVPKSKNIAGYLYAWLSSDYARQLITHHTYGAVIDEISDGHVSEIPVPLCRDQKIQKQINTKVLAANRKRFEAYQIEQEALDILNKEVIYAQQKRKPRAMKK